MAKKILKKSINLAITSNIQPSQIKLKNTKKKRIHTILPILIIHNRLFYKLLACTFYDKRLVVN